MSPQTLILLGFNTTLFLAAVWVVILLYRYAIANDEAFGDGPVQLDLRFKIFRAILALLVIAVIAAVGNSLLAGISLL